MTAPNHDERKATLESPERGAGRSLLLWLIGVPIPIILLIWLFTGRC